MATQWEKTVGEILGGDSSFGSVQQSSYLACSVEVVQVTQEKFVRAGSRERGHKNKGRTEIVKGVVVSMHGRPRLLERHRCVLAWGDGVVPLPELQHTAPVCMADGILARHQRQTLSSSTFGA